MDAQKELQPPKQQPMIYICGGKSFFVLIIGPTKRGIFQVRF